MLTVGASSTRAPLARASAPRTSPTRATSSGSQVAPSAAPHGRQADAGPAGPVCVPRAPLGPSVIRTAGMPSRGTDTVCHMSAPAVSAAFSSSVSWATSAAMSRPVPSAIRSPCTCAPTFGPRDPRRAAGGRTSSLATGPSECDRVPVGEAGGVVAAHRAVLEEAPALLAVERRPGHVVDDAEGCPGGDGRVAQVVRGALDPPPAVAPVGVAAVAGADVEGDVAEGGDLEVERAPAPLPEPQPGPLGQAGAGPVADLDLGPAELLDPPVGPHPHGVVEGAVPVG